VHLRVVPNLNGWLAVAGLTGESALPSADPDQDGAPNLVEYAFDSDATVPMDQPLVRVELDAHGQPAVVYRAWSESVGNLLTDYEAGGVRYEMETSSTATGPWAKSADAFDANVSLMETTDGTRQLGPAAAPRCGRTVPVRPAAGEPVIALRSARSPRSVRWRRSLQGIERVGCGPPGGVCRIGKRDAPVGLTRGTR
jgi:hypothetical protein